MNNNEDMQNSATCGGSPQTAAKLIIRNDLSAMCDKWEVVEESAHYFLAVPPGMKANATFGSPLAFSKRLWMEVPRRTRWVVKTEVKDGVLVDYAALIIEHEEDCNGL